MNLIKMVVVAGILCIMDTFSMQAMADEELEIILIDDTDLLDEENLLDKKACLLEPLFEHINSNEVEAVQRVINAPSFMIDDLNFECSFKGDQWTPMTLAASKGNVEIAKLLVSRGADIRHINSNKKTPLDEASYSGYLTMVEYLSEFLPKSEYGYAALWAARKGKNDILKYFIETKGVSVDYVNTNATRSSGVLLAEAACNGKLNTCKYLISKGATLDYHPKSSIGTHFYSALEMAAQNGQLDIVKYLIEEHHAKLYNALELAEKEKKPEIVDYLKTELVKEIREFKAKLEAVGDKYEREWKNFCDESVLNKKGELEKIDYIYSDMVMSLNSALSKMSVDRLPEDIAVDFDILKIVCRYMNSCAEELATLAKANRKLTEVGASFFDGIIGMLFDPSGADECHRAVSATVDTSKPEKALFTEEKINTAYKNLINRINILNKRRCEKWQELYNTINHHL